MCNSFFLVREVIRNSGGEAPSDAKRNEQDLRLIAQIGLQVGHPYVHTFFDEDRDLSLLAEALSAATQTAGNEDGDSDQSNREQKESAIDSWGEEIRADQRAIRMKGILPETFNNAIPLLALIAGQYQVGDRVAEDELRSTWSLSGITATDTLIVPKTNESIHGEAVEARTRGARSTRLIYERNLIEPGTPVHLDVQGRVQPEVVTRLNSWMSYNLTDSAVTWSADPVRPLHWSADPKKGWTPTALRDEFFRQAGLERPSFSAADAWCVGGRNLYEIARPEKVAN